MTWEENRIPLRGKLPGGSFEDPVTTPVQAGPVYYDPASNTFVQLRKRNGNRLIFSEPCRYFEDAKTSLLTQSRTSEYLSSLEEVADIEEFPGAERDSCDNWKTLGS